ncbi:MAG: hypothetical protein HZT40_08545 [Candidatus Thiothrix singaporensis]|uniref:Uncharacterized protein n=1 Tax=Candidatus Thiothrix singaporensis TaxID=2799669 RepID=A0A7L6AR75_9GAMM|nr:MAG: hypothetical protein HZT40_08545 [Candidatus Thiothrix singaporensis]
MNHDIAEAIRNKTEDGYITLWTERIAQLSEDHGIPVQNIDWSGSPLTVAGRVASYISRNGNQPISLLEYVQG